MTKKIKSITNPKLKLEILTPSEVKQIHDATLWIIEKVGVRFPSEKALKIWLAAGAEIDWDRKIVRAKGELIEKALKSCPPGYTLSARDPQQDLPLDGNHVFVGTDGCGVEVIDIETGDRRVPACRMYAMSPASLTPPRKWLSTGCRSPRRTSRRKPADCTR